MAQMPSRVSETFSLLPQHFLIKTPANSVRRSPVTETNHTRHSNYDEKQPNETTLGRIHGYILAAGVGFAIRGGIFDNWGGEFGQ
ncbi:MAG: hypothetical protein R3F13_02235 [Prosthecobacter sp.]